MGVHMREDDIYISSFLDLLNLRFAPVQGVEKQWYGGIEEMVVLQKEFHIFKKGRSFKDSAAVLNLGGFSNTRAKNRWFDLLAALRELDSNVKGLKGDEAVVAAMIANLSSRRPLPVHFHFHDMRKDKRVLVVGNRTPVLYIDQPYLSVSFPMKPRPSKKKARAK